MYEISVKVTDTKVLFYSYSLSDPKQNEMINTLLITDDFVTYAINDKLTKQTFCLKQHAWLLKKRRWHHVGLKQFCK